jgi:hypothetical protein
LLITIFTLDKIPFSLEFFRGFRMEKFTQVGPDVLAQLCPIFFTMHMLERNLEGPKLMEIIQVKRIGKTLVVIFFSQACQRCQ